MKWFKVCCSDKNFIGFYVVIFNFDLINLLSYCLRGFIVYNGKWCDLNLVVYWVSGCGCFDGYKYYCLILDGLVYLVCCDFFLIILVSCVGYCENVF